MKRRLVIALIGLLTAAGVSAEPPQSTDGQKLYGRHCLPCHQADGYGVPNMQPAITGGNWVKGDAKALVTAHRLIDHHRLAEAAQALEAARAALARAVDAGAPTCSGAWRLETVLAALYNTTGKQDRARRMALVAHRHAVSSGCPLAEARTRELVDRLVTRPRRVARGSAGSAE